MRDRSSGFLAIVNVLIIMSVALASPRPAAAQAVAAGPLTGTLSTTEPTTGIFTWGPVKMAPGLVISEAGHDSNIFDEAVDPKDDWMFRGTPDVSIFSTLRFAKISAYAGSQLAYFKTYSEQNSAGYEYRGRIDFLFSRIMPFVGAGETRARTRPNVEIDTRADQRQQEVSGGLSFELGPHSQVYLGAGGYRSAYFNSVEDGVDLSEALNHDTLSYSLGVQTAITPLATLTVDGTWSEDLFESAPLRNAENLSIGASLLIGAEAVITGTIGASYEVLRPVDPAVESYDGVAYQVAVTYPFLEIGRLSFALNRSLEYSFDEAEAYYQETSATLSYTHRLFGEVDFQVRGSKSWLDYGYRAGVEPRTDTQDSIGSSVGYNLRNRTRISLNYELARRRSLVYVERNYDRTRIYLSWAYAF